MRSKRGSGKTKGSNFGKNYFDFINGLDVNTVNFRAIKKVIFGLKNRQLIWLISNLFPQSLLLVSLGLAFKFKNEHFKDLFVDLCKFNLVNNNVFQ